MKPLTALAILTASTLSFAQEQTTYGDWAITSYDKFDVMHTLANTNSGYNGYDEIYVSCGGEIWLETESEVTLGIGFSVDSSDIYEFDVFEYIDVWHGEEPGTVLAQLKAGKTLVLHELKFHGYSTTEYSLIGFTAAYEELMQVCDQHAEDLEHGRVQRIHDIIQETVNAMTIGQGQEFYRRLEAMTPEESDVYLENYANEVEEWNNRDRTGEHPGCSVDAPLDTPC